MSTIEKKAIVEKKSMKKELFMNGCITLLTFAFFASNIETPVEEFVRDNDQKKETFFTLDEKKAAKLVQSLERESEKSFAINTTEDESEDTLDTPFIEEVLEENIPETEDLTHFVKQPTVKISKPQLLSTDDAYENLSITLSEKLKISDILTTMAENNVLKLLFEKKRLEKLGHDINHVHPVRFLGTVFSDKTLINCMHEIRRSSFKWEGFLEGFSKRFEEELRVNNIHIYVPGLVKKLGVKEEKVTAYVNRNDFEGLVLYLMKNSKKT